MRKWHSLVLQIFALACTYLIISTTGVGALEIRIFTSGGQELAASIPKFSDLIQKDFSFPYQQNYQYAEIKLASKSSTSVIKKVYVFRCKGLNPSDCIQNGIEPVISSNSGSTAMTFDETYMWDDVSTGNVGNFLLMVKLDMSGKEIWTASWDKLTKTGINSFNKENYESDRIDLYLGSGASGETVKSYIETYYSIPSDNMNKTIFASVSGSATSKIYDLSGNKDKIDPTGTGVPSFYYTKLTGNVFNKSYGTWDFVFAADGKTSNPAIFYSTTAGPQSSGGASLTVDDWSPQVVTCGSSEVIKANMHATNASMGYYQSYYYTIGGVRAGEGTMTCSVVNPNASMYSYQCSIPVATFPACSAPGTATVNVYFNYQGGVQLSGSFPITLKAPLPKISVSSLSPTPFDCGIDKAITARLYVFNPSSVTPTKQYTFDGKNFNALNCTGSGENYVCTIGENSVCQLMQENLGLTFKFTYGDVEVLSLPSTVLVTFPPPSLGVDTVTPQTVEAGKATSVNVLLHINYPDFMTYTSSGFNFKYLSKAYAAANCSLETSYSNIKYYKCSVALDVPADKSGVETISFRLDGFKDSKPHQIFANAFYEILPPTPAPSLQIISTSSPLRCVQDSSLTVTARADNIAGTPATSYSLDSGKTYKTLVCSSSSSLYTCTIAKDDICTLMDSSVTLLLKFVYSSATVTSNPQTVYVTLPEPHMQVYSLVPDTLTVGDKTTVIVNLFVQEPKMAGTNPVFTYTYLTKASQKMTCSKVSSTSNRDFYECTNVVFEVPADYASTAVPVTFAIQGTTISFPLAVPVGEGAGAKPWLEIISTTPSRIEIVQGNQTQATFSVTVHNAAEASLKHQASVVPNSIITSGTCTEASLEYNFDCNVVIKTDKTTKVGAMLTNLTLRVTGAKNYDIKNSTIVYVIAEGTGVDIQSISPATVYCEGSKQQNPEAVKVTANAKSLGTFSVLEEDMGFNGKTLVHTARYCTLQGQTISCTIPTDKLFEGVTCGSGELAPGSGSRYYPLTLTFLVSASDEQLTISGSKDIEVVSRPLEQYLDIVDSDVVGGMLQSKINCLGTQSIKLGDTGYVRIMYADLLHAEPKDDLIWSFKLEAEDGKGKLTKGMGTSPDTNSTVCKFRTYQKVGVHRVEDYECSLYMDYKLFQRCESGDGQITLVATAAGKKAEGKIDAGIVKDDSKYQFDFDVITAPSQSVDCQIQSEGKAVPCSLASDSNQNVTIRIYNKNAAVGMADLSLYDFDITFKDAKVPANERSLGNCQKLKETDKYLCPFQIGPTIKLPDSSEYVVTNSSTQTELPAIEFGSSNITIYVKYAGDLERKALSKLDGSITIVPKKTDSLINMEKMREKMAKNFESFKGVFKTIIFVLSFCAVCSMGNSIVDTAKGLISGIGSKDCSKSACANGQVCNAVTKKCEDTAEGLSNATAKEVSDCKITCTEKGKNNAGMNITECLEDCSSTGWTGDAFAGIVAVATAYFTIAALLGLPPFKDSMHIFPEDEETQKNDFTTALESGIKWGIGACVMPRIVGELGAWIAPHDKVQNPDGSWTTKESGTEKAFGVVSAIGEAAGGICDKIIKALPVILGFLQFYIAMLQFQMCMDMVQTQVETSSQYLGATNTDTPVGKAQQAQATAQAGITVMNSMMQCFSMLTNALNQLSTSLALFSAIANSNTGGGTTSLIYFLNGNQLTGTTITAPGTFIAQGTNLCKGGTSSSIVISGCGATSSPGSQTCNNGNVQPNPASAQLPISSTCPTNSVITVAVSGTNPQSQTFTYTASGSTGSAAGTECTSGDKCTGTICCSRTVTEFNQGKKYCVTAITECYT
ncbi:MAG: hypothetical protein NTU57_04040 [Candidatus Aenigmarchaeota archaeon]|nr:hypothetical protein [Candidatus Aenigmarchaeota archaeon]